MNPPNSVLLDEEARAVVAAVLLVGKDEQDEVARKLDAFLLRAQERVDEHRDPCLHVERAAPPDEAALEAGLEGRMRPLLADGRHDVHVALEQERRRRASR